MNESVLSDTEAVQHVISGIDKTTLPTTESVRLAKNDFPYMKDILHKPADYKTNLDEYAKTIQRSEPVVLARLEDVNFISGVLHALQTEIGTRYNHDKLIYYADTANAILTKKLRRRPEQADVIKYALSMYKSEMEEKYKNLRMVEYRNHNYLLADSEMTQTHQELKCEDDIASKGIFALHQLIHTKNSDRNYIYIATVSTGSTNENGHTIVDTYLIRQLCSDSNGITSCSGYLLNEVPSQKHEQMKRYSLGNHAGNVVLTPERDIMQVYQYKLQSTDLTKTLFEGVQGVLSVSDALNSITNGVQKNFEITTGQTRKVLQNFITNQFEDTMQAAARTAANALQQNSVEELTRANESGWKIMREAQDRDDMLSILLRNGRPFITSDIDGKRAVIDDIKHAASSPDIFFEVFYDLVLQKLDATIAFQQDLSRNIMDGSFVDIGIVHVKPTLHDRLRCMPYQSYLNFRVQESPVAWCLVQHGESEKENKGVYVVWNIVDNADMRDNIHDILRNTKTDDNMHALRSEPMKLADVVKHIKNKIQMNNMSGYRRSQTQSINGSRTRVNSVYCLGVDNTKFSADDELFAGTRFAVLSLNEGEDVSLNAKLISKYENDHSANYMGRRVRKMFDEKFKKIQKDETAITVDHKTSKYDTVKSGVKNISATVGGVGMLGGAVSAASSYYQLSTAASVLAGASTTGKVTVATGGLLGLPWTVTALGVGGLLYGSKLMYDHYNRDQQNASEELKKFYKYPTPFIITKENNVDGPLKQELQEMNRGKYEKFFDAINEAWKTKVTEASLTSFEREWLGALQENVTQLKGTQAWNSQVFSIAQKACTSLGCETKVLDDNALPVYLDPNFKENMIRHSETLHEVNALFAQVQALKKMLSENWIGWLNNKDEFALNVKTRSEELITEELQEVIKQCTSLFGQYFQNAREFRETTNDKWRKDHPHLEKTPISGTVQYLSGSAPVQASAQVQGPTASTIPQVQPQVQQPTGPPQFGYLL